MSAEGTITVDAHLHDDSSVVAAAGQGGAALALGAQVAILNDSSTSAASINSGAQVVRAGGLVIQAGGDRTLTANAVGVAAGVVAAGADVAQATAAGSAIAQLGSDVQIGLLAPISGDVVVSAQLQDSVTAEGKAVAAGIGAGAGNDVDATINPTVTAEIGDGASVTTNGLVTVMPACRRPTPAPTHWG